jgi:hypothetical protein
MRSRRDRNRAPALTVTPLEDRTVPRGSAVDGLITLAPQFYLTGPGHGFLTGPQAGDYQALAAQALVAQAPAMGLATADVADPITESAYSDGPGGNGHVYFRQKYNGLPVLGAKVGVHLTAAGEVITVNGGFVPGLGATNTGVPGTPTLTWAEAVDAAGRHLGLTAAAPPTVQSSTGGIEQAAVVDAPGVSVDPVPISLAYVNTPGGVKLGWRMVVNAPGIPWYEAAVDARSGELIFSANWAHDLAGYRVQALPDESPLDGPSPTTDSRQLLVNPADPVASPFGWHDTDGVAGAEFTDTRGNNVFAQEDRDGNDFGGRRPNGGPGLFFSNPVDFTRGPDAYVDAVVANLFYMNNALHDIHYRYGFTEAAGNFQQKNYTGGGKGNDAVQADALDGSDLGFTNNAFMATPPDGFAPRMGMFRFDITTPNRTSDFDNGIIAHEYGHGVTIRLTGGPDDSSTLNTVQSGGMGEGWSDFYSVMFAQRAADRKNDTVGVGNYVLGFPANGPGVRRNPYSFDLTLNPITYDAFNADRSAGGEPQVHNTGEIWASTLWDLNWLLIDKYGFDPDLSTGYTGFFSPTGPKRLPGGAPGLAGNKLTLRLVMDALKLQPANPSFTQARDAILSADLALTGGQAQREIWAAFARRGLGKDAAAADSTQITITTDYDMPDAAADPAVVAQSPAGVVVGGAAPASLTLTFSEPMNTSSFGVADDVAEFTGPGGVDLKGAITGFTWSGDGKALTVTFTPPAQPQGRYALKLNPTVESADDGSRLNQNLDGIVGGADDAYTAHFGYDAAPLTASPAGANGTLASGDDSVLVTFNEPVDPATLGTDDLNLTTGTVTAFVQTAPNQVRYDVTGLEAGTVFYSVKLGAVNDIYGFANPATNGSLPVVETPPPVNLVPLTPLGPIGWQVYQGAGTTFLPAPGAVRTFDLNLDAGTRVTAVVDQVSALRPRVTLTGPLGTVVGSDTADAVGLPASTGPVAAAVSGAYRLTVEGADGTTGAYRVRLLVGATAEGEGGGVSNDTRAGAEPLDGAFTGYGGGAAGAAVVGAVGPGDGTDHYAVTLAAGEALAVGLARPAGGAAGVEILGPTGAILATGAAPPDANHFAQAAAVTAGAAGTYFVRVSTAGALTVEGYVLSAVKNGVIEREGNPEAVPQPVALAPGTVIRGGIADGADQDWYSVSVPAGATLTVSTATPGGGPGEYGNALDPRLVVKQGTSTVGTGEDEAGDGRNALVRVTNTSAGAVTYKVGVTGRLGSTGEYLLRATTDANPGPVGVRVGGPYAVAEGGTLTLAGGAVDPNGGPLTFDWDLNGDGVFGDVTGATPAVPWATLQGFGVDDGPGLHAVFVRVSDGTTTVDSTGVVLTVANAPPAGTPTPGGTVGESAPLVVGFLDAADPSAADQAAGLRYSYDFDNDGRFDDGAGDGTYAGSVADPTRAVPADLVADGTAAGSPFAVRVRVLDKDGGFFDQTIDFTVVNTPPVAEFLDPGVFLENQPGRRLTVGPVVDSFADRQAGFRYSVDLDGNGLFDDGLGDGTEAGSIALPGGAVDIPPGLFPEGPATITVNARIWDKDGASSDFGRTIVIANAPPTAAFTNSAAEAGGIDEGGRATVSLEAATDPSPADVAAGLRYSFGVPRPDGTVGWFAGDGTYAGSAGAGATAEVPPALLDDGSPAGVAVVGRVMDKDGGFTDYPATIPVRNVAPTATPVLAAPGGGAVTVGAPLTVTFNAPFDPSAADTAAGFRYSLDVNNDGLFDNPELGEVADGTSPVITFPGFEVPGPAVVRARIADKDGGFTDYELPVTVANVAPAVGAAAVAPVPEGGAATVRVTASHPSRVTTAAGFRYAYDFDGDGTFDLGGDSYSGGVKAASAAIPAALLTDGNVTRNVTVRVFEVNGLFADVTVPVEVLNVAPTATLVGPPGRVEVRAPATFRLVNPADPSPQDTAAGFRYSFDFNNDGDFADPGEVADSPTPTATTTFPLTGPYTVRVRVSDKDGGFTDYTTTVTVGILTKTWYAAGVGADNPPVAKLYDPAGTVRFSGQVFDAAAAGGVRVSTADVNGDGTPDLVAATGPGVPAEVVVIDGATQGVLFRARPFGTFAGGAYVATGDIDGDGRADIAVSPDEGGGPRVVVYSGAGFRQVASFFGIADPNFRGGARVAMADVNGDGLSDLLVAAGFGGGPRVAGYDGRFVTTTRQKLFNDFFAFDPSLRNGVFLSGGDLDGDGRAEVVIGAGPGGGPQVLAFDGAALLQGGLVERANFFAHDINNRNGVRVTVADIDGDGRADVVTGDASGPGLNVFRGRAIQASGRPADEFGLFPFDALMNGVFVG